MKQIPRLLSAALAASLMVSCARSSEGDPAPSPKPSAAIPAQPAQVAPRAIPPQVIAHKSGLIKLATIKALPATRIQSPTTGYPGRGFHAGVITDATTWAAVHSAAGLKMPSVDWKRQMVAYVILDAQTNSLGFASWKVKGRTATLSFDWSGIEPFYRDATPGVFAIVDRQAIKSVSFTATHKGATPLGSVPVR